MRSAVFVAPFFAETTVRFIAAAARLDGVRLGLISQDPVGKLPTDVRSALVDHRRIADGLDPVQIAGAVRELSGRLGGCDRLVAALEEIQVPLARVREALGIPGMGVAAAENFRDKSRMKCALRDAGIPCARHRLAATFADAARFVDEVGFPVVVKPLAGAGARNTLRVDDRAALEQALQISRPREDDPVLLEEFIVGEEHSLDSVTLDGRTIWHSLTHYTPGPLEVMDHPWIQWTVLLPREVDHPRYDDIRRVGTAALSALGMQTGLSHMEWFRRKDGTVAISEVAARPPGAQFTTLISWAHEVDFYAAWSRLMVLGRFDPPPRAFAAGIAFLRGQGQGRVRAIHGLDRAQAELGSLVVEVRLPRRGQLPAGSYEGEGFVVLRHPETSVVRAGLGRLVELLRVELG